MNTDTITEAAELIKKIRSASKLSDIMDTGNMKTEFHRLLKMIHPDKCKEGGTGDATAKLTELKQQFIEGISYSDDAGEFKTNGYFVDFAGDEKLLKQSLGNYRSLKSIKDDHFHKYMPSNMELIDGKLKIKLDARAVPLSGLDLPQEHVNWILSRMLEFSAWLAQSGYVHCGFNPESVFIVPETHGIQVCSFYHLTRLDSKVDTISGKYQTWYPPNLFASKKATSNIDLELCKKTAIYLLGDKSGTGIRLKKTHNEHFMDFVIEQHYTPHDTYDIYRKMLKDNFETKFHILNI